MLKFNGSLKVKLPIGEILWISRIKIIDNKFFI